MASKGKADRVIPKVADEALKRANGDRKAAYSQYIRLRYSVTGNLAPGCNNKDLQAYYNQIDKSRYGGGSRG